jgi:hypothetical protein
MSLSKKSKILLAVIVFVGVGLFVAQKIIYKPHKAINDIEVAFSGTSKEFIENHLSNNANSWQDKVVELSGIISSIEEKGIVLNSKIYCQLEGEKNINTLKEGTIAKVKGRVIGYDDLLEELKIDKAIIIGNKQ